MANKEEIITEIKRLIDHHTPYRPVTDSKESATVRYVLGDLLKFVNGGKSVQ